METGEEDLLFVEYIEALSLRWNLRPWEWEGARSVRRNRITALDWGLTTKILGGEYLGVSEYQKGQRCTVSNGTLQSRTRVTASLTQPHHHSAWVSPPSNTAGNCFQAKLWTFWDSSCFPSLKDHQSCVGYCLMSENKASCFLLSSIVVYDERMNLKPVILCWSVPEAQKDCSGC